MSTWLAKALAARAQPAHDSPKGCAISATSAKTPAEEVLEGSFGTNGTNGTASGVSADEILTRFEWTRQRLVEEHGRDVERARGDARAILKVELLNDVRLAPVQADTHRCYVCGGTDQPGQVMVPVLTARPDTPLWLHLEPCHAEHRRRRSTMAEELLRSALALTRTPAPPLRVPSRASPKWMGAAQSISSSRL